MSDRSSLTTGEKGGRDLSGGNTLALAVLAERAISPAPMRLVVLGRQRGGVEVRAVPAPGYGRR